MRTRPNQTTGEPWPHRLPAACAAGVLLWCAWGYCADEAGTGLFWTTAVLAAAAFALPRPLPHTSRGIIWLSLLLTVVCMAANVERLMPAKEDYFRAYLLHRLVTALFAALGVSALFFRMGVAGVTRILLGTLPMTMLTLARPAGDPATAAAATGTSCLWGLAGLAGLLELARQHAAHRAGGAPRFGMREWFARGAWMAAVLGAALWLTPVVEQAALATQHRLMGMHLRSYRDRLWQRDTDMPLFRALPRGFGQRTRLLLTVRATAAPGYLRESVFTTYLRGRWLTPDSGRPLDPAAARPDPEEVLTRYTLLPADPLRAAERMRVDVFVPRLLTAICLPGTAATLYCPDEEDPLVNSNGMVHVDGGTSARYEFDAWSSEAGETAFPLPGGLSDPAYLQVPAQLAPSVSNWVTRCPGLAEAPSPVAAAQCIEHDFADRFAYLDTVRHPAQPDPLIHFMKARAGYCVHFASAAALMLRSRGIPTRVVGGFVCSEWAPWLRCWVVRERQGHAWVEAWDAVAGTWFLVEATPGIGRPDSRGRVGFFRMMSDAVRFLWKRLLALIEEANPLQAVADAGTVIVQGVRRLLFSLWGGLLLLTGILAYFVRRRRRLREADEAVQVRHALAQTAASLTRRLVPGALQRKTWESWDGWMARIGKELPAARRDELAGWIEGYQQLRYQKSLDLAAARDWIAAARRASRH
jgi:hypothetical protein